MKRLTREEIKTRLIQEIPKLNEQGFTDTDIAYHMQTTSATIASWKTGRRVPHRTTFHMFEDAIIRLRQEARA